MRTQQEEIASLAGCLCPSLVLIKRRNVFVSVSGVFPILRIAWASLILAKIESRINSCEL